ncbi:peptidoglycan recognition protein family protein [Shimazuella kribbensis]|uniref:peptidoglycan recognition protein family protein n=1 Tax=Shimazuella kribbensis TaxID=139808 RepID=UPI000416B6F7|nr:N-acetylmuramoyl-L-alanine amidase [Shimazuella kribbensis]
MEIKELYIPESNTKTRPRIEMKPAYITIHETDNTEKGATAKAHANFQYKGNDRQASWHYTVDQEDIYQSLPDNEVAWHAGDDRGPGNMQSIAIEICVNEDGDFEKAKANAAWLVTYLLFKHQIPIENVVQHNKWSGKNCPSHMRENGWDAFIQLVKGCSTN